MHLRLYLMFLGPLEASKPWNDKGIQGVVRFLNKLWALCIDTHGAFNEKLKQTNALSSDLEEILNKTIIKITDDYENLSFNTAIAQMMICMNAFQVSKEHLPFKAIKTFLILLNPLAPHITEELWQRSAQGTSLVSQNWPVPSKLQNKISFTLPVQINGKLRATLTLDKKTPRETILKTAEALPQVQAFIKGKSITKAIYVPNKIINFVLK